MGNELYNRELKWIELISGALHVFSANFGAILRVLLIVFLPICLVESVIVDRVLSATVVLQEFSAAANISAGEMDQVVELAKHLLINYGLLFAVALFLQPVGIIAIAKMTKQYIDGEEVKAGEAIMEAFNKMPAIFVTGLIFGVLVVLLSLPIIPGIYFGIAWGLYYYIIGLEDKSGMDALRGSKNLVKGKWWRTFGYLWLLSAITMLWNTIFQLTCSLLGDTTAANMLYDFLCYISVAFTAVGETMLYLNRKALADGVRGWNYGSVPAEEDVPAEPVEGVVDGTAEEKAEEPTVGLLEEKKENKSEE